MDRPRKNKTLRIVAATGAGALCAVGFALFAMPQHDQGPPQNDMTVDKGVSEAVIQAAVSNLRQTYVYPDKAAALDRQLHAQLQHGEFDSVTSAKALASTLTESLQRDTHDKHLEVQYFEKPLPEQAPGEDDSPADKAAEQLKEHRFNYGFANVGRLHGDIGYIEMHQFARPQGSTERIAAAMTLLADTNALIIDLRKCGGGDPETVMLFASYLYDKPTHLNDIYWRDEQRTEQRWTTATVPGRRYGQARQIYVLTSQDTFSACEDLAYALKNNSRATLVGETTGGGAHPGKPHRLSAHFMMFVPDGRAINPVTHTDWEGVGVVPNVSVPAAKALDTAQIAILKRFVATETDTEWKVGLEHTIADLE